MAFLSKARSAHHQADIEEEGQNLDGAIAALEKITATPLADVASRDEAKEVVADTRARLADLRSQQGKFDEAEKEVSEGLKLAPDDSYFEGHLFEMRGVNEERRAKALAESGDKTGAEAARKRAFTSFEKAIDVQDRVIRKELADAGGTEP
jgi:tetratricopeptide (TPR) repeat protein